MITKSIIQMFLDEIIGELSRGNRLEFRDFGVFEVKSRRARRAQNPRTLEKVQVPPKRVVKFKVGRVMRECVTESGPQSAAEPSPPASEAALVTMDRGAPAKRGSRRGRGLRMQAGLPLVHP